MAYPLDLVDAPITCHAWNQDNTMLAMCPNTSDLLIYKVTGKKFELLYTLTEHTQVISSVDWCYVNNKIVTCSHDRNAYVWTFNEKAKTWTPELVILRLKRAATYVRWAPDASKFLVATGTNKVRICTYDQGENMWKSRTINHNKPTGLVCELMPDGVHFIVSSTDRRTYYLTMDEDEAAEKAKEGAKKDKKGKADKKPIYTIDSFQAQGWANCCAVSPSGKWMAYSSQDAYIRFVKKEELNVDKPPMHTLNINGLPLLSMAFLSETCLIGAGFDCQPRLFYLDGDNWTDLGLIDTQAMRDSNTGAAKGGLASKMAAFGGKQSAAAGPAQTIHNNIILGLRVRKDAFTTCANDGRIGVWPFEALKKNFSGKKLF